MSNKSLLIVESPTKVKTIQQYLGSEYDVLSCVGHVKDLPKNDLGIDIDNHFKIELSVQTDLSSYSKSDLISINGISQNSNIVNLSILNQNNDLVWAEQVSVKSNGGYSTLAIADGEGWENSGTYNIKVEDGTEIKSIKFTFTS